MFDFIAPYIAGALAILTIAIVSGSSDIFINAIIAAFKGILL